MGTFQNNHVPLFSAFLGRALRRRQNHQQRKQVHVQTAITEELQIISRLRGAGAGAPLSEDCAVERIPVSGARKAAPSIIPRAAKCSKAAQPAGSPDVQQEGTTGDV